MGREQAITLVISSAIGTAFGAGWWFSAVGSVPAARVPLLVLGVVAVVALGTLFVRLVRRGAALPPAPGGTNPFGPRYGIAVALMLVAIFAGSRVLSSVLDLPEAVPAWVLLVVGLHFLPFVRLFGSTRFRTLAWLLCGVAVVGAALGALGAEWAWRAVPGFGGAAVLWSVAAAGLLDGLRQTAGVPR
ncbi:hypothetical protein [Saccharothrix syringae]|uniref:Uncharacterized protein n=1 Tax=Saccharothrix syringae TaxID=103733 RepID=A0A5Q0GXE0_SACSY|nr:hypothetical protein [Saccharothrix syringae]QFZ18204.1 hypothetical protein EKG83_12550 [Saccharothrix syringae]